jgi:hypothetical protein
VKPRNTDWLSSYLDSRLRKPLSIHVERWAITFLLRQLVLELLCLPRELPFERNVKDLSSLLICDGFRDGDLVCGYELCDSLQPISI